MSSSRTPLIAGLLGLAGLAITVAAVRRNASYDDNRVYMGVTYEVDEMDTARAAQSGGVPVGWFWRIKPDPGKTRYLGDPGSGVRYPSETAANAAAQSYIMRQKLYPGT